MLRWCNARVVNCFKCMERAADKITGIAGPFFVGFAWLLMGSGVLIFFETIAPGLSYPLISIPICLLIASNLLAHYYYVCTVHPGRPEDGLGMGEGRGWNWAPKRGGRNVKWSPVALTTTNHLGHDLTVPRCGKCQSLKPERTHHCRSSLSSGLIYSDAMLCPNAHSQWINQCVGLRNERHFILFMSYFVLATSCFVGLGYPKAWEAINFGTTRWPYWTPEMAYIIIYILALALGLAVSIMLIWNIYQIGQGVTTVEGYDYGIYADRAKERGEAFVNSYNLGFSQNLAYFFNVIPSGYPLWVLLLPLRTAPYTNGFIWARKKGYARHVGVRDGEEMTDDED